jgi:SNF2 family DNA or RNA helicase
VVLQRRCNIEEATGHFEGSGSVPRPGIVFFNHRSGWHGLETFLDHVVLMQGSYNPQLEEQGIKRVHRLKQTHAVKAVEVLVKNPVDEFIEILKKKKRDLSRAVVDGVCIKSDCLR